MAFGKPQTPLTPEEQLKRRQNIGVGLAALSETLRGGDPVARTLGLMEQFEQQEQQAEQQRLNQQLNEAIDSSNIPQTQKTFLKAMGVQQKYDALYGQKAPKREIVKGADGYNYYADTGKRVLPGIEKEDDKDYKSVKDAAGYLRYVEGPQKGQRVFPEVVVEKRPDIKDEASLRKEFNDQSKYFKGIAQSFGKVLGTDPTAAGDVSLIFAYMKMLDPGSVVREGEQATAAQAAGVPSRVLNLYNRVVTGERLTTDQRADFRKQAQNIYDLAKEDQSLNVVRYTNIAEAKGFKPETIIFDYSKGIQPLIFKKSLEDATLEDLQRLDASRYNEEEREILAKVLTDKINQES